MAFEEIKSIHKSKFPDSDFVAELLETTIKPINGEDAIVFVFKGEDEPIEVSWRGMDRATMKDPKTGETKYNDFFGAGIIVASLGTGYKDKKGRQHPGHGLIVRVDRENKLFETKPPITHKVLKMVAVNDREVTGEKGTLNYRDFVIEEIKEPGKTTVAPDTPKPTGLTPDLKQKWEDFMIENITEPTNETGIHKKMMAVIPDTAQRKPLADVRKLALQELVKEGKLAINDKAQYSVV